MIYGISVHGGNNILLSLGPPAVDVLRRGLSELTALCEHMLATFEVRHCPS